MRSPSAQDKKINDLVAGLRCPEAYPHTVTEPIVVHETHISMVFLAGDYAYKIKKPVRTGFLDYSTLQLRRQHCNEELRLGGRCAGQLYLGVVPVTRSGSRISIQGEGRTVDYAVRMNRFSSGALMSERMDGGLLTDNDVAEAADAVAEFHQAAVIGRDAIAHAWPGFFVSNSHQLVETLVHAASSEEAAVLGRIRTWMDDFFGDHLAGIAQRVDKGFIRECHGDLHLANVVYWQGRMVLFDGIEFNDHLRWIDVLSDAAFLAMDFAAHGRIDFSRLFMDSYLRKTGDYGSLWLLRWCLPYRALVRALAASMRRDERETRSYIILARKLASREKPQLWITHGPSGSGKTTESKEVVRRLGAFCLRSDVERKRSFGLTPTDRPTDELKVSMYSSEASEQTYRRLSDLAKGILKAGYSVVVDATFQRREHRERFSGLAASLGVGFSILDCRTDLQTLRRRIANRATRDTDASDADLHVLDNQLAHWETLSAAEQTHVRDVPDLITHRTDLDSLPLHRRVLS